MGKTVGLQLEASAGSNSGEDSGSNRGTSFVVTCIALSALGPQSPSPLKD